MESAKLQIYLSFNVEQNYGQVSNNSYD